MAKLFIGTSWWVATKSTHNQPHIPIGCLPQTTKGSPVKPQTKLWCMKNLSDTKSCTQDGSTENGLSQKVKDTSLILRPKTFSPFAEDHSYLPQCPSDLWLCHECEFGCKGWWALRSRRARRDSSCHQQPQHSFQKYNKGRSRWWCLHHQRQRRYQEAIPSISPIQQ